MPELPEVETVRRGLVPSMEGATIARAMVNRPDLRWPFPPATSKSRWPGRGASQSIIASFQMR